MGCGPSSKSTALGEITEPYSVTTDNSEAAVSPEVAVSSSNPSTKIKYTLPDDIGEIDVVILDKPQLHTSLGVGLFSQSEDEFTSIIDLKETGLFPEWNAKHSEQRLRKGDRIVTVNGIGGPGRDGFHGIVDELRKTGRMHVTVKRADNWVIKLPIVKSEDCKSQECCICLRGFDDGADVLQLNCGHAFHPECAREQLQPFESLDQAICSACWDLSASFLEDWPESGTETLMPSKRRYDLIREKTSGLVEERTTMSERRFFLKERTSQSVGSLASTASTAPGVLEIPKSSPKKKTAFSNRPGSNLMMDEDGDTIEFHA